MIFFVLVIVTGFDHILGRPSNMINTEDNGIRSWPLDENMFLLPRMLQVNEEINVTISAKDTSVINLNLVAENKDKTQFVICSVTVDMAGFLIIKYNDMDGNPTSQEMETENCILRNPDMSEKTFSMQFKRRENKNSMSNNALIVDCATGSRELELRKLSKIRYIQFNGSDARVSKLQFTFQ